MEAIEIEKNNSNHSCTMEEDGIWEGEQVEKVKPSGEVDRNGPLHRYLCELGLVLNID